MIQYGLIWLPNCCCCSFLFSTAVPETDVPVDANLIEFETKSVACVLLSQCETLAYVCWRHINPCLFLFPVTSHKMTTLCSKTLRGSGWREWKMKRTTTSANPHTQTRAHDTMKRKWNRVWGVNLPVLSFLCSAGHIRSEWSNYWSFLLFLHLFLSFSFASLSHHLSICDVVHTLSHFTLALIHVCWIETDREKLKWS